MNRKRLLRFCVPAASLLAGLALLPGAGPSTQGPGGTEVSLEIARIFFEFNSSANDLGVHVSLDGEDWKSMKIVKPGGQTIFAVEGKQGYAALGMTELFFEGAEPTLDEFPLADLLALFPAGTYDFSGKTVDMLEIDGEATLSHAIPDGPDVSAVVGPGNSLVIGWSPVTSPPPGFPDLPIDVVGFQVIVGSFQVTLPATTFSVTVPPEFVASLPSGTNPFEVLAIEASGNQSITEGTFVK